MLLFAVNCQLPAGAAAGIPPGNPLCLASTCHVDSSAALHTLVSVWEIKMHLAWADIKLT